MNRILVIQTAFIGDVILATPVIAALRDKYPQASISILVRAGNEGLLKNNPHLDEVLIWNKQKSKYFGLLKMAIAVRKKQFDAIYNLHRFGSSGFITWFSSAAVKAGFAKNPFSFCYTIRRLHNIGDGTHEIERNLSLIDKSLPLRRPEVFPSPTDQQFIVPYLTENFVCIAPASVWFTKQYPADDWTKLCNEISAQTKIYLLGAPGDVLFCEKINSASTHTDITILAGKLSLLQSAALMKKAQMNYVNDSAPLHLASAVNARVRAVFCSTVPDFGFGPVSDDSKIIERKEKLYCRPCGLHGYHSCPEGHFKCAHDIKTKQFFE